MKAEDTINRIRGALGGHLAGFEQKSENRVYVEIRPETVIEAGQLMFEEIGARLQICTGIDTGQGIEVMYHWALDTEDCVVTVRVTVPYEDPKLESIAGICPATEWIEREMWELLGVEFNGPPDMRHLLLSDDWPEGNYPLRKTNPDIPEFAQQMSGISACEQGDPGHPQGGFRDDDNVSKGGFRDDDNVGNGGFRDDEGGAMEGES
mgnify:FL=1